MAILSGISGIFGSFLGNFTRGASGGATDASSGYWGSEGVSLSPLSASAGASNGAYATGDGTTPNSVSSTSSSASFLNPYDGSGSAFADYSNSVNGKDYDPWKTMTEGG